MLTSEEAEERVRHVQALGLCGELSADQLRVCIQEQGHEGGHPWINPDNECEGPQHSLGVPVPPATVYVRERIRASNGTMVALEHRMCVGCAMFTVIEKMSLYPHPDHGSIMVARLGSGDEV